MSKVFGVEFMGQCSSGVVESMPWIETTTTKLIDEDVLRIGDGYRAKNSELVAEGIPFARAGNINNGLHFLEADHLPSSYLVLVGDKVSQAGDTVFTSKGTVGRFAFVKSAADKFIYSPQLCFWRSLKPDELEPRYLYYWMHGREFLGQVEGTKGQTDMADYVNLADQRKMVITLPPIHEQRAIAAVLSAVDDKIDLLHRQNKTLKAMAETMFRQWFVEEADEIWESSTVGVVLTVKAGTTPSTSEPSFWDGAIPWSTPRDLSNQRSVYLFDTNRKITPLGLAQIGSGLLPAGTVLLSSRAPIGYLAIADIPVAINQGYIAIICDDGISNYYVYLWCWHQMDVIKSAGNGSTFEEISKSSFKALTFQVPAASKIEAFDGIAMPIFEKLRTNERQILNLEMLHDTLLPKLISGEVRVAY